MKIYLDYIKTSLFWYLFFIGINLSQLHSEVIPPKGSFLVTTVLTKQSGMFALFNSVLGSLNLYQSGNYSGLKIDLNDGFYLDPSRGPNWWEYYFEPINLGNKAAPHYVFSINEILSITSVGAQLDRKNAFALIQKYVHIKPHIQKEIDSYVAKNFKHHYLIGVHHRGTDKFLEVPIVPYEKTLKTLLEVINNLPRSKRNKLVIYIATDEMQFITYLQKNLPYKIIYNDFARSDNGYALHASNRYTNNYEKGREALLDCILLSKCNLLIRPNSTLSIISSKFNPNLPEIVLSY
ncbi:MAG: hypothetical protein H0W88_03870 [Parachlamydiaceae bacterium]|nr:hypothetical protein [Parachlamydiaceae bacterium]